MGKRSSATGAGLSVKLKKTDQVVLCFFGDGATGEGVLYESLNFAALKKLPMIFVCENNLYSTHLPVKEIRPDEPIFKIAEPFGIKTMQIDGNDVLKVYDAAKEAQELCRKGEGSVFIECLTYRMRGHVGPDDNIQGDHTDIRPEQEVEEWRKKDPIKRLENYILENNIIDNLEDIKKEISKEVEAAHKFAEESPCPDEISKYVFK